MFSNIQCNVDVWRIIATLSKMERFPRSVTTQYTRSTRQNIIISLVPLLFMIYRKGQFPS